MRTVPLLTQECADDPTSPILTCLPPHPGPAAVVAPKLAYEPGLSPRMAQGMRAMVGVLRGAQKLSRILPVAGKVLHRAECPGGPEGSSGRDSQPAENSPSPAPHTYIYTASGQVARAGNPIYAK